MAKLGQKSNGIYFLDVTVPTEGGHKRQRISCDTRDRADAERQKTEWLIGAHPKHFSRGTVIAPKGRDKQSNTSVTEKPRKVGVTMDKLFAMCEADPECWKNSKAQATIRSNIKLLGARIGEELVADMTHKRLCALRDEMLAEGYKPASVKRKLDMVSKALRMAEEVYEDAEGAPLIASKPRMPRIEVRNNKSRVLSSTEELLVFAAIDKRMVSEPGRQWQRFRMFIRILLDTGFRRSEGLALGPSSVIELLVDGEPQPFLSLAEYTTKNDKPRIVPATEAVAELIPALNMQAVNGRWFPLDASAWYMWSNIRDDVKAMGADIDDVGLHTLRHTCITRLALGGMELQRLSMWAGHSDVSITANRYSHLSAQALAGGVAILGSNPAKADKTPAISETSGQRNSSVTGGNRANLGTITVQ